MSDIYLQITETPTVVTLSAPVISGALSSTVTVANVVTVALDSNSLSALESVTVTVGAAITGTVTVGNFPSTQTIAGTVTANPTGTQTIAGTVTANNTNLNRLVQDGEASNTFGVPIIYARVAGGALDYWNEVNQNSGLPVANQLNVGGDIVPFAISGTVTIGSALPAGTNRIGVVTIGAGTVTIGAGISQIGSVTASLQASSLTGGLKSLTYQDIASVAYLNTAIGSLPALAAGTAQIGSVTASISNSVTIGSLPAISGTVTANLSISSTAITSGSFTSLTSATLVPANTARKMATVYNLGAGQLFINAGASATTLGGGFMVALSGGDFYECDYTTTTLSAIFATAGTASWFSH
jgi:hypothetical protein